MNKKLIKNILAEIFLIIHAALLIFTLTVSAQLILKAIIIHGLASSYGYYGMGLLATSIYLYIQIEVKRGNV